ncbi:uncharacterized protein LOC125032891 [Penaeus chinensis]|uniref:uncharacterized protein LOC125032891 n=1 Tax=Penaeus chinensis TaxID=139456 RepID=UPI001FB60B0C|nr:uncharacterized protein LOC125032891 [Penaeus chinensis]
MVRPDIIYGLETATLTKGQEKKLEVAEMKMMRYEVGVSRKDKVRNINIRETLGIEKKLTDKIKENRRRWFGHVYGRDERYVGKRVMKMTVGKRTRRRPERRWSDCNKEDLCWRGGMCPDQWRAGLDKAETRCNLCGTSSPISHLASSWGLQGLEAAWRGETTVE